MLTDTEYYDRLRLLLERVVLPFCKRLLNNYLQSQYLTLFTFLDRNKHRIMHCFRHDAYCCFQNKYKCVLNETQTLSERAWGRIFIEVKTKKCIKDGCICHVLTKSRRMPKFDIEILTFLIREFNIIEYKKFPALKELEKFSEYFHELENTRVKKDEYLRNWNTVTNSLLVLGLESTAIDEVKRTIPSPIPVQQDSIIGPLCRVLMMGCVILIILGIPIGGAVGLALALSCSNYTRYIF